MLSCIHKEKWVTRVARKILLLSQHRDCLQIATTKSRIESCWKLLRASKNEIADGSFQLFHDQNATVKSSWKRASFEVRTRRERTTERMTHFYHLLVVMPQKKENKEVEKVESMRKCLSAYFRLNSHTKPSGFCCFYKRKKTFERLIETLNDWKDSKTSKKWSFKLEKKTFNNLNSKLEAKIKILKQKLELHYKKLVKSVQDSKAFLTS